MATKNIVPRATGEGKLGTSSKKWLEINTVTGSFELLKASGLQDGSGNDLIVAGDNITVNKSSSGQFEISGSGGGGGLADLVSDTSPQLGGILDLNSFNITGSGDINITGNLTADATISASIITASNGFSGSLTQLSDGSSYLIEGTGISIVSESNGAITISSSGGGGSSAADDITLGNAEVNIKTTSGNINLSGSLIVATGSLIPGEAGSFDLGATTKEWKDLYLKDDSVIYFGDDQDVRLVHDPDDGLILSMSSPSYYEPYFRIKGNNPIIGSSISLYNDNNTASYIGSLRFASPDSAGNDTTYAIMAGLAKNTSNFNEIGEFVFAPLSNGTLDYVLRVTGSHNTNKGSVNIANHDGSEAGLQLAGTLVTATANELNLLDGGLDQTSPTSTIVDDDRFIINDNGTMTHVSASVLKSYIGGGTTYASQAADFTAESGYHYGVDTSSGIITADLPSVTGSINGSIRFKIKAGTNALVLEGAGSETIDGFSSFIITDLSQSLSVMSDGVSNWEIF